MYPGILGKQRKSRMIKPRCPYGWRGFSVIPSVGSLKYADSLPELKYLISVLHFQKGFDFLCMGQCVVLIQS
ncbi:hypothetical protein AM501_09595 [Aneurinibacillus migulanus]|nr:hypothetical protein TS64_27075 [Aneurinibacillus migulanus]KPD08503.1 hypothetical protein AM501_09595 [Aneurinibacillus migulanus]